MNKKFLILLAAVATAFAAHAVTFKVKVPSGTKKCFVCGKFNNWDEANAPELQAIDTDLFALEMPEVTDVSEGYKYLCGRSWEYVEKAANGDEIENRTATGNPDEVGSWRNWPENGIETFNLILNGIERQIKVYLPEGYDTGSEAYPLLVYNTVQQRYNNAGNDGDAGDYFFGPYSWNAQNTMESLREKGLNPYILVQVCSFMGENTADAHKDYTGTGYASEFLAEFVDTLLPELSKQFRIDSSRKVTIVGADYGALFSIYATLTRPDIFGTCVAMSPMLWINNEAINSFTNSAKAGQTFYVTAGSKEPAWMLNETKEFADNLSLTDAKVYYTVFDGASHHDESWGESFRHILPSLEKGEAPVIGDQGNQEDEEFAQKEYSMYSGRNDTAWKTNNKGPFTYTTEFYVDETTVPVPAFVFAQSLGSTYTSAYYWNVSNGPDASYGWLFDSPQTIGFNSNHKVTSWQRVAILQDGTVKSLNAMYNVFKIKTGNGGSVIMNSIEDKFTASATVSFSGTDKSFYIAYGSVNSGEDMGACTAKYNVGDDCTEALIEYDFLLNKVTVTETKNEGGNNEEEKEETPFEKRTFTLYASDVENNLQKVGTFSYTTEYYKKGTSEPTPAFVITHDVDAKYKDYYYWNVADGSDQSDGWLMTSCKNIKFSSSHNTVSWLNIAIYEDGTIDNIAAHSSGFRVVTGANKKIEMAQGSNHDASATVSFTGSDKTFTVNFGSVNSASDQGAVTPKMSVSPNCLEALITYDFNLNKATIKETKFGEVDELPSVTSLQASAPVSYAGNDVTVKIATNKACTITANYAFNFGSKQRLTTEKISDTEYNVSLPNAQKGMYTLYIDLNDGTTTVNEAGVINIRVLDAVKDPEKMKVYINPYAHVNWEAVQRYKANFHTHTSQSFDTQYATSTVVDRYKEAGYKILALTDHDANSYPWTMFDLYNSEAEARDPEQMGMLAIPGNELSKDRRNNWSESTGGEFNHHNDFFTGRKGQEFMSLRESYAYTKALGGMQIINHPGQYWDINKEYKAGEKNSPEWHADNFNMYSSLVGLEVYNQGNRRPYDRILWDQILTLTMPARPVWGYSCDDTHSLDQYFNNYQFMLMDNLTVESLKDAMSTGRTVFSYEYNGSGEDKAPHVKSVKVDETNKTITVDSDDADSIEWIYSTHRTGSSASSTQSTVIGLGDTFNYDNYQGSYVRARLTNQYGETATQPIAFVSETTTDSDVEALLAQKFPELKLVLDKDSQLLTLISSEPMTRITVVNAGGQIVKYVECDSLSTTTFSISNLAPGAYIVVAATTKAAYTAKFVK